MKTLIITCIYSNLFGTELGGRPSRFLHYRQSLLSILKMNPTKVVCFTTKEEINGLKDFFYVKNNISSNLLEFIEFELTNTKYFDEIRNRKDIERIKKWDRCFEIQYNKFFWFSNIVNVNSYDRVYWFDAGLSHGGIFPEEYRRDKTTEGFYHINLFNSNYLNYLNNLTKDKFLLVSKNNTGSFFWSQQIPTKYYKTFDRSEHIIGGFFGGTPEKYSKFSKDFELLLCELLKNEGSLFMEELIMSCLYFNDKDFFTTLKFDDWYKRPNHVDNSIKYFYNMFEI